MAGLDHFGILAPFYERFIPPGDFSDLIKHLRLPCAGWLLDAAGGTGRVSRSLGKLVQQTAIVDESAGMLRQAVQTGLVTARSTVERLPFADGFFDRILMVDAFHHVADQPGTARELWRVIKPGGRIVIEEPDIHQFGVKLIAVAEKMLLMRSHFLTAEAAAGLFSAPQARVELAFKGAAAWVIVDKTAD